MSAPATVAAMMTATLTVTPVAIPASASTSSDAFGGTLSIRSVGGPVDETDIVLLHQTARGAVLSFNPTTLTFASNGTQSFSVANSGNLAAPYTLTVGGAQASEFAVTPLTGTAGATSHSSRRRPLRYRRCRSPLRRRSWRRCPRKKRSW